MKVPEIIHHNFLSIILCKLVRIFQTFELYFLHSYLVDNRNLYFKSLILFNKGWIKYKFLSF